MVNATVLILADGVQVVVPDSLDLITPYVLREQLDFFEDELRFVRKLLQPGHKVVEIGANYGVYTLPMAKRLGAAGHVWALEPASSTAEFLRRGIAANGFEQVTLVHEGAPSASVPLVSLDECMDRFGWTDIELIKISAKGAECDIVKGGRRFFADLSPLVQFELRKDTDDVNIQLIDDFASLGYEPYRLVPGLNILVPLHADSLRNPYLLNLFCCKAGRADALAARGVLLRASDLSQTPETGQNIHHWRRSLAHLPYAVPFVSAWEQAEAAGQSSELIRALSSYACSRDPRVSRVNRFRALEASFLTLKELCAREPARLRLASLARAAHTFGERGSAVDALTQLLANIHRSGVDPGEPFLAPLERFDSVAPEQGAAHWLVAAVLEQLEHLELHSSFLAGPNARERLEDIRGLGLGSAEMARRLKLVNLRYYRDPPLQNA